MQCPRPWTRSADRAPLTACSGKDLEGLGEKVTWTTRLRADAALHGLAPAPSGRCGRPRLKGGGLPALKILAACAAFTPVMVTRYGKTTTIEAAVVTCLWYPVFGSRPVQVVQFREPLVGLSR